MTSALFQFSCLLGSVAATSTQIDWVMYNNHVALSCSCPDHVQRTRVCKHMYAVQLDLNRRLGQPANQRTVQTRSGP